MMDRKKRLFFSLSFLGTLLFSACSTAAESPVLTEPEVHEDGQADMAMPAEDMPEAAESMQDEIADSAMGMMDDLPDWYTWELTDINSQAAFRVADFQGKVVLVETMAVWCSKCLQQQQEVVALNQLLGKRDDFVSIGINIDPNEDESTLSSYTAQNGFDWLYVVASTDLINEIGTLYGTQYLNPPSTPMLIIDRQGEAHLLPFGIKSAEDLQSALDPFFNEG